jgi:hypothetical protein
MAVMGSIFREPRRRQVNDATTSRQEGEQKYLLAITAALLRALQVVRAQKIPCQENYSILGY